MKVTIFDGAETIGGNKIYVEWGKGGVFLDFGMNFSRQKTYFEEFLNERAVRGVHDSLYLGLIPRLNIYREDLIPSDVDLSSSPSLNVTAVLLSHAHLDHCGCVGFLSEKIPILASPMTLAILKAMRDTGRAHLGSEICYYSQRFPLEDDSRVLKTNSSSKVPYSGRNFICSEKPSEKLVDFLCKKPGQEAKNAKKLEAGEVCCLDEKELGFEIKAFEVDHSIYGATAFILQGDTSLAYTGDIRLQGKNAEKTRDFVKNAKNASILIIEGTRVSKEPSESEVSEKEVYDRCLDIVRQTKGLVIADFSPRNFERLEIFKEIANKTSRELVVTAKDAYMLYAIEGVDGLDRMKDLKIYKELRAEREKWETEVVMERWGERYVDPQKIQKEQENFIICFSYYDIKHLLDIKPSGGAYIYSSSEALDEEQKLDFLRLSEWLKLFNFSTHGFRVEGGEICFERGFHASGHVSREDVVRIVEEVDPDYLIPVHTKNAEWFTKNFENAVSIRCGESREFR
ncbi:MAG: MBL fold metallo-hydrolase [Archaeoglobaceae archaeon]